jgi:hypothetical protein
VNIEQEIYQNRLEILTLRNLLYLETAKLTRISKNFTADDFKKLWEESYDNAKAALKNKYPELSEFNLEKPEFRPTQLLKERNMI